MKKRTPGLRGGYSLGPPAALLLGLCSVMALSSVSVSAQVTATFQPGSRIRLTVAEGKPFFDSGQGDLVATGKMKERRKVGIVRSIDGSEVRMEGGEAGVEWRVPRSSMEMAEVSLGKKGNARKGLLVGSAFGLVASLIDLQAEESQECDRRQDWCDIDFFEMSDEGSVVLGTVFSGLLGLGVGALIRTERWMPAELADTRPVIQIHPRGNVSLALRIPVGSR